MVRAAVEPCTCPRSGTIKREREARWFVTRINARVKTRRATGPFQTVLDGPPRLTDTNNGRLSICRLWALVQPFHLFPNVLAAPVVSRHDFSFGLQRSPLKITQIILLVISVFFTLYTIAVATFYFGLLWFRELACRFSFYFRTRWNSF